MLRKIYQFALQNNLIFFSELLFKYGGWKERERMVIVQTLISVGYGITTVLSRIFPPFIIPPKSGY